VNAVDAAPDQNDDGKNVEKSVPSGGCGPAERPAEPGGRLLVSRNHEVAIMGLFRKIGYRISTVSKWNSGDERVLHLRICSRLIDCEETACNRPKSLDRRIMDFLSEVIIIVSSSFQSPRL
jgi:hypothetical protein